MPTCHNYTFPYTTLFRSAIEERLRLKKDIPELQLWAAYESDRNNMWFGQHKDHPFIDVRLRQAMSLAWDRDTHINFVRSEEHTSELQSLRHLVCRLLLER